MTFASNAAVPISVFLEKAIIPDFLPTTQNRIKIRHHCAEALHNGGLQWDFICGLGCVNSRAIKSHVYTVSNFGV